MPARLILADAPSARDALTFAKRAAQAGAHGVRLQAAAGLLRMSAVYQRPVVRSTAPLRSSSFARSIPTPSCSATSPSKP